MSMKLTLSCLLTAICSILFAASTFAASSSGATILEERRTHVSVKLNRTTPVQIEILTKANARAADKDSDAYSRSIGTLFGRQAGAQSVIDAIILR